MIPAATVAGIFIDCGIDGRRGRRSITSMRMSSIMPFILLFSVRESCCLPFVTRSICTVWDPPLSTRLSLFLRDSVLFCFCPVLFHFTEQQPFPPGAFSPCYIFFFPRQSTDPSRLHGVGETQRATRNSARWKQQKTKNHPPTQTIAQDQNRTENKRVSLLLFDLLAYCFFFLSPPSLNAQAELLSKSNANTVQHPFPKPP